ncbi:PREDICTED: receptor-like protein 12 [Camelina sativa]|uniref:Receptor-like protein 12 n=1 Tax=Camelina sativa TaxID=90675 RepID=A0ABM0X086_CAMSA|nr:PREDICTED: receptor-like protein 12 [Camelina sativa]
MNSCSFTLFTFAAVIFLQCLSSIEAARCHPDDEAGLLAFKAGITQDPSGILISSWKKGTFCCAWHGIACGESGRVVTLDIAGEAVYDKKYLPSTISPSLAKVQHLESIYIFQRKLTGSFPQFLFKLPNLRVVYLIYTGLSGPLPANIGALSQLVALNLVGNHFTGPIPSSISNMTRLTELKLGGNRLSGTIPSIFKSMKSLETLDLSRNRLSGKLPTYLATTLKDLILSENNLSGMIPNDLSKLKALNNLDLSKNRFSGVVPMSFAKLTELTSLHLSHNLLTDPFPALNNTIGGIASLDLSYNKFHLKKIPEWVISSTFKSALKLAKCGIKMSFDDLKPVQLNDYGYIDLSDNDISGSPASFLNQTDDLLLEFRASGNKLRFDMGKLEFNKALKVLVLSRNLIFGEVPKTVVGLKKLNLSQNHLFGKLPATKFPASAFVGNDCLCGSPLPPCKAGTVD